jgi:hypothetical protein
MLRQKGASIPSWTANRNTLFIVHLLTRNRAKRTVPFLEERLAVSRGIRRGGKERASSNGRFAEKA